MSSSAEKQVLWLLFCQYETRSSDQRDAEKALLVHIKAAFQRQALSLEKKNFQCCLGIRLYPE